MPLLEVRDLRTHFFTDTGVVKAVDGVSYQVEEGETLAIVGESGSGKSVSALSIMGLIPDPPGRIVGGEILFRGRDLLQLNEQDMGHIRGKDIGMVFQEPMTSLNPVLTIGRQMTETLEWHLELSKDDAKKRAVELLRLMDISDPEQRLGQYPHHFSGGMRQRVMIAMALSCNPSLLIADEPTTALDVTVQAQILELLKNVTVESGVALIIITHNLGVVARYANRVNVMYAGKVIESASAAEVYGTPGHPYTLGLMASVPRLDLPKKARLDSIEGQPPDLANLPQGCSFSPRCSFAIDRCAMEQPPLSPVAEDHFSACWVASQLVAEKPVHDELKERATEQRVPEHDRATTDILVDVRNLRMHFPVTSGFLMQKTVAIVKAVDDVSFFIRRGETLGLVGESGSGKTTTGRSILQLLKPTGGEIFFDGQKLTGMKPNDLKKMRKEMQIIFQDPYSSLDPRMTAGQIVEEPLTIHKLTHSRRETQDRVSELFSIVGLNPNMASRYPHEFSGGQRQRIGIARALAVNPSFIVCDEAVSALDVSIQAQVLNLLKDLQDKFDLTYLFIAHDLSVVRHVADRIAVMYLGHVVEVASREDLYANPLHPYTQALLSAVPIPDPGIELKRQRIILQGEVPSPLNPPAGCVLHPRCPIMIEECKAGVPALREVAPNHWVACIRA